MRQYVTQPGGDLYCADEGGIIFDPHRQQYYSVSRKAWFPTDRFPPEGRAPANDLLGDIGKAVLTIGTGGLAAPLLYGRGGGNTGPAPATGATIDGVPVSQAVASGASSLGSAVPAPLPTAGGAPWSYDPARGLYASAYDGGIWYDPASGRYYSGRLSAWEDANPADPPRFSGPMAPANGANGSLLGEAEPHTEAYERYARMLEQKAGPGGDANRVLAAYLRLPVTERVRFFLMFTQTEEDFDPDDAEAFKKATDGAGVDISNRKAYEARLRRTLVKQPKGANGDAWYNDVLGGVHLVGSGILSAFGMSGLSETLENVEGDALPAFARKKKPGKESAQKPLTTPRTTEEADDRDTDLFADQATNDAMPRRSPGRRGYILGSERG